MEMTPEIIMTDKQLHRTRVGSDGRIVLPADVRRQFSIDAGDQVIVKTDERGIHIVTADQALRDAQAFFAPYKKPGESIVDELIRERREEAARE
jgi:AbrB family looped-hinge helix DNA binding protein